MTAADPVDERRHEPSPEPLWNESWYLDFFDVERGIGGYVRLGFYPGLGRAWYWACVVGPDRPLVTVIDHDAAIPAGESLELRTEGLWADLTVENPLDHVTVGLEAFAVSTDDPADVYGDLRGERVPLGFDLEWETEGDTYAYPGVTRYEVPCRVHGEVLVGSERIELDGWGQRDHSWGERDWWTMGWSWMAGRMDDGARFHGVAVDLAGTPLYGTGYWQDRSGKLVATDRTGHDTTLGREGFPTASIWQLGDQKLQVEPIAFSPVLLTAEDGRESRFPRAWCRFTDDGGRGGQGWVEWNQPPTT